MSVSKNRKYSPGNSVLMIVVIAATVLVVAGLAYWFWGRNNAANPGPTSQIGSTNTPTANPLASPSASPTATKSPTPTPKPVSKSITVGSTATLDGFEASNGGGNLTLEIRAGRNSNLVTRGFVSFAVPSELSGKTVDKAVMRIYQAQVIGTPYVAGGNLMVDHVNYGATLTNSAYSLSSLSSNFATVTGNPGIEYKDVDVKDQLIDDMANGRANSQYRIHFATETIGGDVTGDFAYFESQDNSMGTGKTPQLVITYH